MANLKKKWKYELYKNRSNSLVGKKITAGTAPIPMTKRELIERVGVITNVWAKFFYDGRIGKYCIYKTARQNMYNGDYYVLLIER